MAWYITELDSATSWQTCPDGGQLLLYNFPRPNYKELFLYPHPVIDWKSVQSWVNLVP
jgi:hypothetical protein